MRSTAEPAIGPPAHLLDATAFWALGGGVQRYLGAKHAWLERAGWRHTIVAPVAEAPYMRACGGLPIPGSGGYRFVLARGRAQRLIEDAAPDLIEAADPYVPGHACIAAARRLQVPAVAFCHSNLPRLLSHWAGGARAAARGQPEPFAARWVGRQAGAWLARLYEQFDLVLAPSAAMAGELRALGLAQVHCQRLGVDTRAFSPSARDPAWRAVLLRRLGVPGGTRLLLYAGRFGSEKNLPLLAEAVRRLGSGHLLLAIGSGPCPPTGAQVRLLKPEASLRRLARLMANVDAFVHAGDQETFGLAVLEALACGAPVAASGFGALAEIVEGAGLVVRSREPRDWARALRTLLHDDPARRAALARTRALAYDWSVVMPELEARYRALLVRSRAVQPAAAWREHAAAG